MKIDIVTDTFAPDINGVSMTLSRLSSGLRKNGHHVHIIHTGAPSKPNETKAIAVELPGYKEIRIGLPHPFLFKRRWKKHRPDVVYVATESFMGNSALKTAKKMNVPAATGFHTNFHQYLNNYHIGYLQNVMLAYLRRIHNKSKMTIAPSTEIIQMLEREHFHNVRLLSRGVDAQLFHPEKRSDALRKSWNAKPESIVILMVSRIAPEKNLNLAMKAFRYMQSIHSDAHAVVVGDGPSLKDLAFKHPHVHFVGMKTGEELAQHYASADILIFPSETETFGNVLLEGLASGLVTVAYHYAACKQVIKQNINGLYATKGDEIAFLEQCNQALSLAKNSTLRQQARRSILSLDWESIIHTFESYLTEISTPHPMNSPFQNTLTTQPFGAVRTLFLSDIHLGAEGSKAREVTDFIKSIPCEKIVLNGDIIDAWAIKRGGTWKKQYTKLIRILLKKSEKENVKIIYCRGNHDDILESFLPLSLGNIEFLKEYIHHGKNGKQYLVIHGDGFDAVSTKYTWIAKLGSVGYEFLLKLNRFYNAYRSWRGKEYFSLSKAIKAKVKSAVNFIGNYELQLKELAKIKQCHGIICGHIHTPENKMIDDIHYLNSGDWVETMSAIIEKQDGEFELVYYKQLVQQRNSLIESTHTNAPLAL